MQYLVLGPDGTQYGPVDFVTLNEWVAEGRVSPATQITDQLSGQVGPASGIEGLQFLDASIYASKPPPQAYGAYPREGDQALAAARQPTKFWGILIWFGIATVVSFFYNWWPLWITGFNVFDAIRARANKDPKTDWCLFIGIGGFGAMILWSMFKAKIGAW